MPGEITAAVTGQGGTTTTPAATSAAVGAASLVPRPQSPTGPLVVVPAGFIGDIVGSLAGTIGGQVGDWFGERALGKTLGSAAGPLISHFTPFQILPPSVVAQSAGPGGQSTGNQEAMVVVPSGFLTGLLGGVGGDLIGGALGDLFGNKDLGSQIGSAAGGALGSIFGPFQIVPPELVPASSGPAGTATSQEAMVVVPAGWLGDLFGGIAGGVGQMIGGDTGGVVSTIGAGIGQILPWSALPPQVSPSSTGPTGAVTTQELVVVPAGWLSSIASTFAGTIGSGIGGLLGNSQLGQQLGDAAAPLIKMIPFSVVPDNLQPAAAGPGGLAPEDQLLFVPAGVFGGLLGSFGGLLGSAVGGLFGESDAGKAVGDVVGQLGSLLPFQVLPEGVAA